MINLSAYQKNDVRRWRAVNFPDYTLLGQCMGMTAEAGNAGQHVLKMEDGRVDKEDHINGAKDDIGDMLIYAMGACDKLDTTLEECFIHAWSHVKDREHGKWHEKERNAPIGILDERQSGAEGL